MIKYICDICENEIVSSGDTEVIGLKLGSLDFTNEVIHLCNSCYSKFNDAKEELHSTYETRYNFVNESYLEDLREIILEGDQTNE